MIKLDEAISREYEIVDLCEFTANTYDMDDFYERSMAYKAGECAKEHKQIAEWLKQLKRLKEQEPCEDAVSRVDLIDKLETVDKRYGSDFYWEVRKIVDNLPSVTPVQKKGKWLNKNVNCHHFYGKCSKCGKEFCVDTWYTQNMKYCPNCGARMENNQ